MATGNVPAVLETRSTSRLIRVASNVAPAIVLLCTIAASVLELGLVADLRNAVFDAYQRWHPRADRAAPVRIVTIDDESLERVGQWPWPRTRMAALVQRLREAGAAVIAFDMVFADPDRTSPDQVIPLWQEAGPLPPGWEDLIDHDAYFADVVGRGGVVTGFILTQTAEHETPEAIAAFGVPMKELGASLPSYAGAVPTLPRIAQATAGNGALNVTLDGDGVLRWMPLFVRSGIDLYPSLAAETLRVFQGLDREAYRLLTVSEGDPRSGIAGIDIGNFHVPTDEYARTRIYSTKPVVRRSTPAWRVLDGDLAPGELGGLIVLVGLSATGIEDDIVTALKVPTLGIGLHAQLIEQILGGVYLHRPHWALVVELFTVVAVSLLVLAVGRRAGPGWAAVVVIVASLVLAVVSWLAFTECSLLIDPVMPVASILAVYLVFSLLAHMRSEQERRWVRRAFASYVSPELVEELVADPAQLKLGGERRELTFLFTDLTGFTGLVETMEPTDILPLLNHYLDGIVRIVFRHDGTIDKIVGDAVHIIFGAPVARSRHAALAVACALEIDTFAGQFAAEQADRGVLLGETRVGINTGIAMIGNFGGALRFDYTAHGDAINTTARLESVNRYLGTRVCVSEETVRRCPEFSGRPVGTLLLKGKTQGVTVYEPLSVERARSPAIAAYGQAYELLQANDPAAADALSTVLALDPGDRLAAFHLSRVSRGQISATIQMTEK